MEAPLLKKTASSGVHYELTEREKAHLLWVVYPTNFIIFFTVSQMGPYYEPVAKNHYGLSSFQIGLIMGSHSFFSVLGCVCASRLRKLAPPRRLMITLLSLNALASFGFATLNWLEDTVTFAVLSVLMKSVQGFVCGSSESLVLGLLPNFFEGQELTKRVGVNQAMTGVGLISGPMLGGILNTFGYFWNFFSAAFFSCIHLAIMIKYFPTVPVSTPSTHSRFVYLKSTRAVFAAFAVFFAMFATTTPNYFLSSYYQGRFSIEPYQIGFIFGLNSLVSATFNAFAQGKVAHYPNKWVLPLVGLTLRGLACQLYTPASFLPQSGWFSPAAFSLGGLGSALCIVPSFLIMLQEGINLTGEARGVVSPVVSSTLTIALYSGIGFAALFGYFIDEFGYHTAYSGQGIFMCIYAAIWAFVLFSMQNKEDKKTLESEVKMA